MNTDDVKVKILQIIGSIPDGKLDQMLAIIIAANNNNLEDSERR